MTDHETDETNEDLTFRRRDVLKTVGAAGAVSALGAETAAAKKPKEFIVGMKTGKGHIARRKAKSVKRTIDFGPDIGEAVAGRWPEEALKGLRNNPHVRYIEEDGRMHAHSHPAELQWGVDRVDAEFVHAAGGTGANIDVAILDTGIDLDHTDLVGNLGDTTDPNEHHAEIDCVDASHPDTDGCDEDWDDDRFHGTHVAGIVGATANGSQVIGVAPGATLHSVKVLNAGGSGSFSAICAGMEWAIDQGFDVLNMSLGACCPSCNATNNECDDCTTTPDCINDAMDSANDNKVIVVASAGNDGNRNDCGGGGDTVCGDNDCVGTPASHPDTIAVSSTDINDNLSAFSSVGTEVDVTAPGSSIPSTWNDGTTNTISGTSMSAPHVTGAVAILLADGVDPDDVLNELTSHAESLPGLSSAQQGAGLIDVADMVGESSANDLLEVETDFADDLDFTEATLHGTLTRLTGSASATVRFEWDEQGTTGFSNTVTASGSPLFGPGFFEASLTNLEEDTGYKFRAKVTNAEGSTEFGTTETFSTLDNLPPNAAFTVSPDPVVRNEPATFDASGSSDPDDSITLYEWDWDYDETFAADASTTSPTIDHTFTTGGTRTVALRVTDGFDQTDIATDDVTVYIRLAIDIQPSESDPNSINPNRKGNVPVAVLHTSAFDPPTELDPSFVHFGDPDDVGFDVSHDPVGGATPAHAGGHVENVDSDGDLDSLFHFPIPDTGFESDDTEGELVGLTNDGVPVFGTDSVNIVGGGGP